MSMNSAADKIHEKFETWRQSIRAKFEQVADYIRGLTSIVYESIWGVAYLVAVLVVDLVRLVGVFAQLLLIIVSLILVFFLGYELGGILGWTMMVGVILIPIIIVSVAIWTKGIPTSRSEGKSASYPKSYLVTIFIIANIVIFVAYGFYFESRLPRTAMLQSVYGTYITAKCFILGERVVSVSLPLGQDVNTYLNVRMNEQINLQTTDSVIISISDGSREFIIAVVGSGDTTLIAPLDGYIVLQAVSGVADANLEVLDKSGLQAREDGGL